jgi:hypothetical protein
MDDAAVRSSASDLLLDRGVLFNIKGAPLWMRLLRLNRLRIRPMRVGTILTLDRIVQANGLGADKQVDGIHTKLAAIAELIAVAVLGSKLRIRFLSKPFARFLLWKLPARELIRMHRTVASANQSSHFTTITVYYVITTDLLMTAKTGLNQGS